MVTEGDLIKVCRFQAYRLCIIKVYTETYIFSLTNITQIRSIKRNKNKESQAAGSCEVSPRAQRGAGGRKRRAAPGAGGRWGRRRGGPQAAVDESGASRMRPRESSYFERLFLHGSAQRTPVATGLAGGRGVARRERGGPFWRGRGLAQPPPDTHAPPPDTHAPLRTHMPPAPARPPGGCGRPAAWLAGGPAPHSAPLAQR